MHENYHHNNLDNKLLKHVTDSFSIYSYIPPGVHNERIELILEKCF